MFQRREEVKNYRIMIMVKVPMHLIRSHIRMTPDQELKEGMEVMETLAMMTMMITTATVMMNRAK